MRPPRPARERAGYILALAYSAIVGVSLWHLRGEKAEGKIDTVDVAMHLLLLATIGGTTVFLYRLARRMRADVQEKKRLMQRLADHETTYRAMFDNALEGMFQTTPEGRFISANKALARMYGYDSPEHLMASMSDIGRQLYADPAQRAALFDLLKTADVISNYELEMVRADGSTLWLRANARAVRDGKGELLYVEGTVEDISARHWGEQRRRLHDAAQQVLDDAASVAEARPRILGSICEILDWKMGAVWDVDEAAQLLRCVEIWQTPDVDIAEFDEENINATHAPGAGLAGEVWQGGETKWIANLAAEASFANARIAVKSGMGSAFGVPIKVSGRVRHVLEFFSPKVTTHDPELLQTLGAISRQIGHLIERKEADRATSELAAVVANSNDAIVACTLDGVVRSWNAGAEQIYGYTVAEAIGRSLETILPPDRLDEFPQMLATVKQGNSLSNYETVRLRKDGRKIGVSLTDSPIRDRDGRITGVSSIARDITERRRLEEELLQSQKMDAVGRLAGGIAHDFNNILTVIVGYSDLLVSQIADTQPQHKHLVQIRKAADFAAALTGQLLAFSRRQALNPRVFTLDETVRDLQKILQRVIGEDIKIETDLRAKQGQVKADPSQIEQVLLNLCVNARDAMPRGGSIRIATAEIAYALDDPDSETSMPAGEYVKMTIADTGSGIPPDVLKHIFEPFFTTKEKGHGTGLGLSTCYGIVKQSGGFISLKTAVDAGTTFSIYLPRVDPSGEKAHLQEPPGHLPGGRETILYVEDEITVRNVTAQILRGLGYTVLEAGDGSTAREVLEMESGREIDMLFSDVVLPDSGGRELSEWVRSRSRLTKLLFTSGYIDETILRRHGLERDTAFLQKPFSPMELAKKVRETMDSHGAS